MPVKEKSRKSAAVATPTDAHLHQQPTTELLQQLVGKEMYSKWNSFGVYLGIKQNVRDGIKQQMQGDPEACFRKLCSKWLLGVFGTGEIPRTWKTVLNAVRECEYPQVADNAEKTLLLRLTKTDIAVHCIDQYKVQLESLGLTKKMKQLRDLNLLPAGISILRIQLTIFTFICPSTAIFPWIIYHLKEAMQRDHKNMDEFCTFVRLEFPGKATAIKIASDMKEDFDRGTLSLKGNTANFVEDNRDPVATDTEGSLKSQNRDEGYSAWCTNKGWIVVGAIAILIGLLGAYMMQGSELRDESVPNLPGLPTAFTGRSEEVKNILSYFLLIQEQIQVVAITGGPGYGKSSLAIVCAHKLARKDINVHHILLNEVSTIVRFTSKVLLAFDELHNDKQLEDTLLMQIKALQRTTVLVLDNADHLTLKTSKTKYKFLALLIKMTSTSPLLKMIVTTRYQFNMIDRFRQIHLQALSNSFTIDLLSSLLLTSSVSKSSPATNSIHIQQIANLTGGIPLAVKVVCHLLNAQIVSMDEVVEGLSVRPIHTLSHETFSPEEQLNRCFNLSYTYLSQPAKLCFVYASRFPDAFSIEAGRTIAAALTTDPDCLQKLAHHSLLEYDVQTKRYSMHLLLRHFVQEQESVYKEEFSTKQFQKLYVNFYMDHLLNLSTCMSSNRSFCTALYSKIELDHGHFLFSLSLLSQRETNTPVLIPIKRQLEIAEKTFPIIEMAFPPDILIRWWSLVLKYSCRRYNSYISLQSIYYNILSASNPMFTPFVAFARKFGQFWIHAKEDNFAALNVYELAFNITQGSIPVGPKISCVPMHEPKYVRLLQDLANVYKTLNQFKDAQALSDAINKCEYDVRKETDRCFRIINLYPEDEWCTNGLHFIEMQMRESPESARVERYSYIFTLDYLFLLSHCNSAQAAIQEMQDLEANLLISSEFLDAHTHSKAMLSMSKVWDMLYGNVSREVYWLEEAVSVLGDDPSCMCKSISNQIKFLSHFRLARLYFTKLGNISKALYHSQAAYDLAESTIGVSFELFVSVFRLANLLFANESFNSSMSYFQQAASIQPLVYSSMSERHYYSIHKEIHNRLLKLASLGIWSPKLGGVWDYYQWYKDDLKSSAFQLNLALTDKYESFFMSPETALSLSDGAYSRVDVDSDVFRIVQTFRMDLHAYSWYVWTLFLFVFSSVIAILPILYFVLAPLCVSCYVTFYYSISTSLYYYVAMLPFSFHYFLYSAIWKGQLWLPTRLPVNRREVSLVYLKFIHYIFILVYLKFIRYIFILCFVVIPFPVFYTFLLSSNYLADRHLSHPINSLSLDMDKKIFADEIIVFLQ